MFNSVTGVLTAKQGSIACLKTGGMEWAITLSANCLKNLPEVGDEARIFLFLYHRQDILDLYGFALAETRELFLALLKVDGIGPRQALRIIGQTTAADFSRALESKDLSALESLPGVGKKTAQKILLSLRGKLAFSGDADTAPPLARHDIVESLIGMGFGAAAANQSVKKIVADRPDLEEAEIFRQALRELSV